MNECNRSNATGDADRLIDNTGRRALHQNIDEEISYLKFSRDSAATAANTAPFTGLFVAISATRGHNVSKARLEGFPLFLGHSLGSHLFLLLFFHLGLVALLASLAQGDERVGTEAQAFLLVAGAVSHAPEFAAVEHDVHVQAAAGSVSTKTTLRTSGRCP